MDPKVCGKLLTTHRRGYGVDVEALHDRFPLRRSAGKGHKIGGRPPVGRAPLSRRPLGRPPAYFFLLYIPTYPENIQGADETQFPPP